MSASPPDDGSLAGAASAEQGMAHIKTITETGGQLLGCRDLALDSLVGLRTVSHRMGGTVFLYEGATRLRAASPEEAASLPVLKTWDTGS